jgi:uncharacterized protein (DUF2147 family)
MCSPALTFAVTLPAETRPCNAHFLQQLCIIALHKNVFFMKKLLFFFAAFLFVVIAFAQDADAIIGFWKTGDGNGIIQIYKKGEKYFGKIVWLAEPNDPETGQPKKDKKNDDEKLRSQPILGLENLTNISFVKKGLWEDGKIYDPKSGNTYRCIIKMEDGNTLKLRGYVGVSLFGRTDTWKRQSMK